MSESHVFVRPASALDASSIGAIHAKTMIASLRVGADGELPASIVSGIDAQAFGQSWAHAIIAPPSPDYAVFAAIEDGVVCGFACVVPTMTSEPGESEDAVEKDDNHASLPVTAEITALEVSPDYQRRGHGSRLLSAIVDDCRRRNVQRIQAWTLTADESRTSFFSSAGLALAGLKRSIAVGQYTMEEQCWHAAI